VLGIEYQGRHGAVLLVCVSLEDGDAALLKDFSYEELRYVGNDAKQCSGANDANTSAPTRGLLLTSAASIFDAMGRGRRALQRNFSDSDLRYIRLAEANRRDRSTASVATATSR
jgi:hypothetical protein